jgi:hypothetical protein
MSPSARQSAVDQAVLVGKDRAKGSPPILANVSIYGDTYEISTGSRVLATADVQTVAFCGRSSTYRSCFVFVRNPEQDRFVCDVFECANESFTDRWVAAVGRTFRARLALLQRANLRQVVSPTIVSEARL